MKKNSTHEILLGEEGFALVAALIASVLLLALGIMVIYLSTQDLRTSASVVGDKKALAAADTGVHQVSVNFNPANLSSSFYNTWTSVDATNDPNTQYYVNTPTLLALPPYPITGYSMQVGQGWGIIRYSVNITGRNTIYNSSIQITEGIGYGPISLGTSYR